MPSDFPDLKQVAGWNTRFCPTPSNYMHLGHFWTWLLNYAFTPTRGQCILRLEDMTANAVCHTEPKDAKRFGDDFIEQMTKLGLPPGQVIWQSDRQDAYAEAAKVVPLSDWRKYQSYEYFFWLSKQEPYNWRSESVYAAVLGRVVDDHDFRIAVCHRGEELACENETYKDMWNQLYGVGFWKPTHIFIPIVKDWTGEKVSKSAGTQGTHLFLKDFNFDPGKVVVGLAKHYMNPTLLWSYVEQQGDEPFQRLAHALEVIKASTINPDPEPLTEAEVASWMKDTNFGPPGGAYYYDMVTNKGMTATSHWPCPKCNEMVALNERDSHKCPVVKREYLGNDQWSDQPAMAISHWDCPKCKAHVWLNERDSHKCPVVK